MALFSQQQIESLTFQMGIDDSAYQAGAKRIETANLNMRATADQVVQKVEDFRKTLGAAGDAYDRFAARTDATTAAQIKLRDALEREAKLADLTGASADKRATTQAALIAQYQRTATATEKAAGAQAAMTAAMAQASAVASNFAARLGPAGAVLSAMGPIGLASAAALGVVTGGMVLAIREAEQFNQAFGKLQGVMKATGGSAGLTATEIAGFAQELQDTTLASDKAALDAAAALATVGAVTGDSFKQTIKLAQDMSAVFGGDLRTNTLAIARAMEDPIEGLDRLRRAGIAFTSAEKDRIQTMARSGDIVGAQAGIYKGLEDRLGGAGTAERSGIRGAVKGVEDAWHDMLKEMANTASVMGPIISMFDGVAAALKRATPVGLEATLLDERNRLASLPTVGQRYVRKDAGTRIADIDAQLATIRAEAQREQGIAAAFGAQARAQQAQERATDTTRSALQGAGFDIGADGAIVEKRIKDFEDLARAIGQSTLSETEQAKALAILYAKYSDLATPVGKAIQSAKDELEVLAAQPLQRDFVRNKIEAEAIVRAQYGRVIDDQVKKITTLTNARVVLARAEQGGLLIAQQASAQIGAVEKSQEEATKAAEAQIVVRNTLEANTLGEIDLLNRQLEAAGKATLEYDALTNSFRSTNKALTELNAAAPLEKTLGADKARELATQIGSVHEQIERVTDQQERLARQATKAAQEMVAPYKNAATGIGDAFADAFTGIFDGTSNLVDDMKRVLIRFAGEMASLLVFRPVLGGVLTAGGFGNVAQAAGLNFGPGIGGAGPAIALGTGTVTASASELGGFNAPSASGFGGLLTNGFNIIGPATSASFFGPTVAPFATSAINSSPFGLLGAAGGFGLSSLGIGPKQNIGGTLGGLGGGLIGGAFGGPIGSFVGGLVGDVAGNFLGDLFGFGGGDDSKDAENAARAQAEAQRQAALKQLEPQIDAFKALSDGGLSGTGQALKQAADQFTQLAAAANELNRPVDDITEAFHKLQQSIRDDFLESLTDATAALNDPGSSIARALDKQAKDLRKSVAETGVGGAEAEALIALQRQKALEQATRDADLALGQLTGDVTASFADLQRQGREHLSLIKSLGGDEVKAQQLTTAQTIAFIRQMSLAQRNIFGETLTATERFAARIADVMNNLVSTTVDQSNALSQAAARGHQLADALRDLKDGLEESLAATDLSEISPLSAGAKYQMAQQQFQDLLARAQGGDTAALGQLAGARGTLLTASQGLFGGSDQFQQDYQASRQAIEAVRDLLDGLAAGADDAGTVLDRAVPQFSAAMETLTNAIADGVISQAEQANITAAFQTLKNTAGVIPGLGDAVGMLSDKFTGAISDFEISATESDDIDAALKALTDSVKEFPTQLFTASQDGLAAISAAAAIDPNTGRWMVSAPPAPSVVQPPAVNPGVFQPGVTDTATATAAAEAAATQAREAQIGGLVSQAWSGFMSILSNDPSGAVRGTLYDPGNAELLTSVARADTSITDPYTLATVAVEAVRALGTTALATAMAQTWESIYGGMDPLGKATAEEGGLSQSQINAGNQLSMTTGMNLSLAMQGIATNMGMTQQQIADLLTMEVTNAGAVSRSFSGYVGTIGPTPGLGMIGGVLKTKSQAELDILKEVFSELSDMAGNVSMSTNEASNNPTGNPADASIGFATGGWVRGGIPGIDSVNITAQRDEFIVKPWAARQNAALLEEVNRTGQANFAPLMPAAGHDPALVAELRALRQTHNQTVALMGKLIDAVQSGNTEQVEVVREQTRELRPRRTVGQR